MTTEWGSEIATNGVRPNWLRNGTPGQWLNQYGRWISNTNDCWSDYSEESWRESLRAIRLVADHPYYTVQRYNEQHGTSFVYWPGGDAAPADWDRGEVLADDGSIMSSVYRWNREVPTCDIIGYTRRSEPARDTVEVERRTEADWRDYAKQFHNPFGHDIARLMKSLGLLIAEPTEAERIAAETGVPAETVQRVLDAWS